jgi:hypothetical protein
MFRNSGGSLFLPIKSIAGLLVTLEESIPVLFVRLSGHLGK